MITEKQALETIDNLDDYARMEIGVDPIGPREALEQFVKQYEQLRAENEALRKDAERYRWLRDSPWNADLTVVVKYHQDYLFDFAIDEAMKG